MKSKKKSTKIKDNNNAKENIKEESKSQFKNELNDEEINLNENMNSQISKPLRIATIHEAHEYMKGNEFIIRGYRLNFDSSWKIFKR